MSMAANLEASRITSELVRLGLPRPKATQVVKSDAFTRLTVTEALDAIQRLALILDGFYAAHIIDTNAAIAFSRMHQIAEWHDLLLARGFRKADASLILCKELSVLDLPREEFEARLDAICALLPDQQAFRFFLKMQPEVLRLSPAHLATKHGATWEKMPEKFLRQLQQGGEQPAEPTPPPSAGALPPLPATPPKSGLEIRLEGLGLAEHSASNVASKLERAFGANTDKTLDAFVSAGWSGKDLLALSVSQGHPDANWHKRPDLLLATEAALVTAGFEPGTSRDLVTRIGRFTSPESDKIAPAVATFRELGWKWERVGYMAVGHPRALFMEPDKIRTWHAEMLAKNRDPLNYLAQLTNPRPPPPAKKTPECPSDTANDVQPGSGSAASTSADGMKTGHPPVVRPTATKPRQNEPAEPEKDSHVVRWEPLIRKLFLADPSDTERALMKKQKLPKAATKPGLTEAEWARHQPDLAWMWDKDATAVLGKLVFWLGESELPSSDSIGFAMLRWIVRDPDLHPILRCTPEAIEYRMFVIRRIIGREFLLEPQLLLKPWESLPEREIKERWFIVQERVKRPKLEHYLDMLFAETRYQFLAQLEQYLTGKEPPPPTVPSWIPIRNKEEKRKPKKRPRKHA